MKLEQAIILLHREKAQVQFLLITNRPLNKNTS